VEKKDDLDEAFRRLATGPLEPPPPITAGTITRGLEHLLNEESVVDGCYEIYVHPLTIDDHSLTFDPRLTYAVQTAAIERARGRYRRGLPYEPMYPWACRFAGVEPADYADIMSGRVFVVALEDDVGEEEAADIQAALARFRGVDAGEPVGADIGDQITRATVRAELLAAIARMVRDNNW
jgi:hypothetical protein